MLNHEEIKNLAIDLLNGLPLYSTYSQRLAYFQTRLALVLELREKGLAVVPIGPREPPITIPSGSYGELKYGDWQAFQAKIVVQLGTTPVESSLPLVGEGEAPIPYRTLDAQAALNAAIKVAYIDLLKKMVKQLEEDGNANP